VEREVRRHRRGIWHSMSASCALRAMSAATCRGTVCR
jgi:hypothetical protein